MLSQTTSITKEQESRLNSILTPEKIIDISKGLSNEKRQAIVIDSLQDKIDALKDVIEKLKNEHKTTLIQIAKNNSIARESSVKEDSISDSQLMKSKLKGLHFYGFIEVPKLDFENTSFGAELLYELKTIELGVRGDFNKYQTPTNNTSFNYYLKLRYKFF